MRLFTMLLILAVAIFIGTAGCGNNNADAGDKKTTAEETKTGDSVMAEETGKDKMAVESHPIRNNDNAIVTITTNYGDLTLELWRDVAPDHADSFLTRTKEGFYDGLKFHRVVENFMIQGGDPKGNGTGNAGYFLPAEFSDEPHVEGTLSMARSQSPNSASCQFFICLTRAAFLDKQYTVFGKLLKGYDVLQTIGKIETEMGAGGREKSTPVEPVMMEKVFASDAEGKPLK
jgi:peptidyl-prolyl cis-trans isomerase B (cyclophilin B)